MKSSVSRLISRLLLCTLTVCSMLVATGQDRNNYVWPVKLQKDYSQTYPVGTETVLSQNRFGQMTIDTWDKNEVKVEVHITVGAQTNEYAAKILDRISVVDEKNTESISFITKLGDWSNNGNDYNGGHEMRIDYIVHIPVKAKLHAENSFGPITIGDFAGECELVDKYGTLTGGKLSNCKSVSVEFGKVNIEGISDCKLLFRYSKVDIAKITGNIQAQFDYCNSIDLPIDNSLKQFDLKNNYTSVYLVLPQDFSADYDIVTNNARVTSKYAVLKEEAGTKSITSNNAALFNPNHRYSGSIGKGGGTQLNIKSNFGNVRLM